MLRRSMAALFLAWIGLSACTAPEPAAKDRRTEDEATSGGDGGGGGGGGGY